MDFKLTANANTNKSSQNNNLFGSGPTKSGDGDFTVNFGAQGNQKNQLFQWNDKQYSDGGKVKSINISYPTERATYTMTANKGTWTNSREKREITLLQAATERAGTLKLLSSASGAAFNRYDCKLYSVQLKEGDTLVHDYIPVIAPNGSGNEVPCLYDKVTGELLFNQGTEDFVAGPVTYVVPQPEPEKEPISLGDTVFQVGAHFGEEYRIYANMDFSLLNYYGDVTTTENAEKTLVRTENFLTLLNSKRAQLATTRQTIENAANSLDINIQNLSNAHSTLMDTDFAMETATLTKAKILSQITSSIMTQTNQNANMVMQLLSKI